MLIVWVTLGLVVWAAVALLAAIGSGSFIAAASGGVRA